MKKALLLLVLPLITACGISGQRVGTVALVSEIKQTPAQVQFTNLDMKGTKEGRACGKNILGIYAGGDITVDAAKRNGGISTITSVSEEVKNLIVMSEVCTVVKGY